MSVEPIGFLTLVLALISLAFGYHVCAKIFVFMSLLGSAAAVTIGSFSIQPAHLLLGFVVLCTLTRSREAAAALSLFIPPRPGFWLGCMILYGIIGALLLPRIFSGMTQILPIGSSAYGKTDGFVPLGPVSGNLSQSVYLIADLLCFLVVSSIASTRSGFYTIASAIITFSVGNVFFAIMDIITYSTGTQYLLDFIRNAQYVFHLTEEASGLKRIAGSFTEASSFAHATLGIVGFTGTTWLCGRFRFWSGCLFLVSLGLLVLSTSSTGLAGAPPMLLILYITAVGRCVNAKHNSRAIFVVLATPLVITAIVQAIMLDSQLFAAISDYLSSLVFNKSSTLSGLERASWNRAAMENFFDSFGLGVGLGTARTSSFMLAVLSNVGIPGLVFYTLFAITCFGRRSPSITTFTSDIQLAARNACLGLIIADVISGALVDQGLTFYTLAAMSAVNVEGLDPVAKRQYVS
ncbi:MAG: hypothetical protein ACRYGP_13560 [Janthinobacterium lividum]